MKRLDEPYRTPQRTAGDKGKVYYPKKVDKRDGAQNKNSFLSQGGHSKTKSTRTNIAPGIKDIQSLVKLEGATNGIFEGKEPIYNARELSEEEKLFVVNESIGSLIDELQTLEQQNEK